jgi:D-alanyl-D-alanine dipeptidase
MRDVGDPYRLGIVVEHNTDPREPGGGSCIFMHIWKGADTGTSGCTAMTIANIQALLAWLNPDDEPVLVQLPEAEYERLKKNWQLP